MVSLWLVYVNEIHVANGKAFGDAIAHYFPQLTWWDGKQGYKIAEVNCNYFSKFLGIFVPFWSSSMQSNHKGELESPNSYFNSEKAISDGTKIYTTWRKTNEKTPITIKTFGNLAEYYDSLFLAP